MIVATTDRLDGYKVTEVKGIVFGMSGNSNHIIGMLWMVVELIIGGRGKSYIKRFIMAKDDAMKDAIKKAEAMGANAIIGADFDVTEINDGYLLASLNGTAVVMERIQ